MDDPSYCTSFLNDDGLAFITAPEGDRLSPAKGSGCC